MTRHDGTDTGYFWSTNTAFHKALAENDAEGIADCIADFQGIAQHSESLSVRACAAACLKRLAPMPEWAS